LVLPKKYEGKRKRKGKPQTQQEKEKRKKHRVNGVKNGVNMDLQTMKEEGQRERKIRTACKCEGETKQSKGKQSKVK
jgi:hypothetical protein